MPKVERSGKRGAQREGIQYKGYSKSIRKNHYVDPEGRVFKFGYRTADDNISVNYLSSKIDIYQMTKDVYVDLQNNLLYNTADLQKKKEKWEEMDELYKPGGLGYLFLKQTTKVGARNE